MRRPAFWLKVIAISDVLASVAGAAWVSAGGSAASPMHDEQQAKARSCQAIVSRLQQGETARVILMRNVPFCPEGGLGPSRGRDQCRSIGQAHEALLGWLAAFRGGLVPCETLGRSAVLTLPVARLLPCWRWQPLVEVHP
jgi:hypothetical protein